MSTKSFLFIAFTTVISFVFLISCESEIDEKPIAGQPSQFVLGEKDLTKREIQLSSNKKNQKYVYLTFDDGPNKGTSHVVNSLKKKNTPATLFVVGQHIYGSKSQKEDFEKIAYESLFQIANHSYTHAGNRYSEFYKDSLGVLADFNRVNDSLNRKLMISRTPGRNIWRLDSIRETDIKSSEKSADYLAENGYLLVGWDLEWNSDEGSKIKEKSEEMIQKIDTAFERNFTRTENHLVLLTHDQYFRDSLSIAELDNFLELLNNREDIILKKIKDYPGIQPDVN